jgi:hypothetical protein
LQIPENLPVLVISTEMGVREEGAGERAGLAPRAASRTLVGQTVIAP